MGLPRNEQVAFWQVGRPDHRGLLAGPTDYRLQRMDDFAVVQERGELNQRPCFFAQIDFHLSIVSINMELEAINQCSKITPHCAELSQFSIELIHEGGRFSRVIVFV